MIFNEKFHKPLFVKGESDYVSEVETHLKEYKNFLEKLLNLLQHDGKIGALENVDTLVQSSMYISNTIEILHLYNGNNRFKAIDKFKSLIQSYERVLGSLYTILPPNNYFYRLRTDTGAISERNSKKIDYRFLLFHIPFNLRKRVNNLRFNGHGIPCLYCANNLKTAWIESKRPGESGLSMKNKTHFNAAVFLNSIPISILDFTIKNFNSLYNDSGTKLGLKNLLDYIQLYPLIICLHTKILYSNNEYVGFNNEYVFPSLLMDWLLSKERITFFSSATSLSGFKYSSVESKNFEKSHNFVLPTEFSIGLNYSKKLSTCFLNKGKSFYVFQDEIPKSIKKITGHKIRTIESFLNKQCIK